FLQLSLFAPSAALYNPNIVYQKGKEIKDVTIVIPYFNKGSDYVKKAETTWQEAINYRTTSAYDATQALIKSLEKTPAPNRQNILENLRNIKLSEKETSGETLEFEKDGNRKNAKIALATLQCVAKDNDSKECAKYDWDIKPLD
ncbi:MAG TPA: hypothetical protein V6C58_23260, partial [Allocoleopsis sp.]